MTKHLDHLSIATKQFIDAREKEFVVGKLDRLSREFLDWIVVRCQSDEPLHIQEIVMHSSISSPATAHKSINRLHKENLIEVEVDPTDHRRRTVAPTALALDELQALDRALKAWLKRFSS
jgi:DNA-binding PadR family transcriptional regulator